MSFPDFFAKKSLKAKIMISMLMAGVVPLLIAAIVINWRAGVALEEQTTARLNSLAASKKNQVEKYFETIQLQAKFMAEDYTVVEAMQAFKRSFDYLDLGYEGLSEARSELRAFYDQQFNEKYKSETGKSAPWETLIPTNSAAISAQALYIARNENPLGSKHEMGRANDASSYSEDHARFHPPLNDFLQKFGYYDVFLVEPTNGTIVYSVFKELDFATSLKNGPYADTNFAEAFRQALTLDKGQVAMVDFEEYLPSYQAPASFIAAPIYDGGVLEGVLVFQMPVGNINAVVQQAEGLGESGEVFLVGKDGLMRTQSRLTEEPTLLKRQIVSEGLSKANSDIAISGHFDNHAGQEVLGSYSTLNIPGFDWKIGAEIEADEALAPVGHMQMINFALVAATSVFVTIGSMMFATGTSRRIETVVKVADKIASGDFNNKIDATEGDEVQKLAIAMHRMQTELFGRMREREAVMSRLKSALDNAGAKVMVADSDHAITYLNKALKRRLLEVESSFKAQLPKFSVEHLVGLSMGDLNQNPQEHLSMLSTLTEPYTTEMTIGDRILSLTYTPIVDDAGLRLGTVTEWVDLTDQRSAEKDVQSFIAEATAGRLCQRLDLNRYKGFYRTLAGGLNETMDAVESPINETRRVMEALAEGNLTERFSGNFKGEFKHLEEAVNTSTTRLAEVITQLTGSVSSLTESAQRLSRSKVDLNDRTNKQASALEQTAAAMEEITGTVEHNSDNANNANRLSDEAVLQAEDGNRVVNAAIESIRQVNDSSEEIASITDLINEIAFQTNLLALNAAVEAARAGEQGRGFAVVASEVRALAGRSADAAKQIEGLVKDSISKVGRGTEQVNRTGEALQNIVASITKVSSIVSEISKASEEQSVGVAEINRSISKLESVTQNNLGLVKDISGVSDNLGEKASDIRAAISVFRVEAPSVDERGSVKGSRSRAGAPALEEV